MLGAMQQRAPHTLSLPLKMEIALYGSDVTQETDLGEVEAKVYTVHVITRSVSIFCLMISLEKRREKSQVLISHVSVLDLPVHYCPQGVL